MNIKNIAVKDLIPYEKNTKKHDDVQINNVAESIKQYGFVQPIVIDKNNVVVIGHCRLLAAKKLKMAEVPCVCVEDLTEEQVKALRIVDNKSNESDWLNDILELELPDVDLSAFDFDFGLDKKKDKEEIEGEVPFAEVLGEENNYIVLKFDNTVDWLQLESLFDLETVKAYSSRTDGKITKNMTRAGVGRVVNGADFLNKLGVDL
jgi:site-specific DNA-methyltransferase (adenine-specific)